jgi:hypothetical protein
VPQARDGRPRNEQLLWAVLYYQAPDKTVPALEFLHSRPASIDAHFTAEEVLKSSDLAIADRGITRAFI